MVNLEPVSTPIFEVVTVAELKAHSRILTSVDDTYLDTLRVAAREQLEKDLSLVIAGQQYNLHLEHWLDWRYIERYFSSLYTNTYYGPLFFRGPRIVLPVQPVDSLASITYTDTDGDPATLNPTLYVLRQFKDPPEIGLLDTMPSIKVNTEIIVNFVAGYHNAASVPKLCKQAIMFLAAHWYENREAVGSNVSTVPLSYERIVKLLNVKRYR